MYLSDSSRKQSLYFLFLAWNHICNDICAARLQVSIDKTRLIPQLRRLPDRMNITAIKGAQELLRLYWPRPVRHKPSMIVSQHWPCMSQNQIPAQRGSGLDILLDGLSKHHFVVFRGQPQTWTDGA